MAPASSHSRREYLLALASAGTIGVAGCSGSSSDDENGDGDAELDVIALSVSEETVTASEMTEVTVTARFDDGTERDVTDEATIESFDSAVATVDGTTVVAENEGTATLEATVTDDGVTATDTIDLTVEGVPATLEAAALRLNDPLLEAGETTEATVTAGFDDGTERDVTDEATVESRNPSVAAVDGTTVIAESDGEVTIEATVTDDDVTETAVVDLLVADPDGQAIFEVTLDAPSSFDADTANDAYEVTVTVTNTGDTPGETTVIYENSASLSEEVSGSLDAGMETTFTLAMTAPDDGTDETIKHSVSTPDDTATATTDINGREQGPDEVGWTVTDPGEPLYSDDPNWRLRYHDTGKSLRNPHAEGPTSDPDVLWKFNTGVASSIQDYAHQPTIIDGTVYTREWFPKLSEVDPPYIDVEFQSALVAIDAETGADERKFEIDGEMYRPTILEETVYVNVQGSIRAYDLHSGDLHWETEGPNRAAAIYPVGDTLLVTDTKPDVTGPEMAAFDIETGERKWEYSSWDPTRTDEVFGYGVPTVTETVAHFPETAVPRRLDDGEPAGRFPVPVDSTLAEKTLLDFTALEDRAVGAYGWQKLDERWTRDGYDMSNPTLVNGVIVSNEDGRVVGIDAETGDQLWEAVPEFEQSSVNLTLAAAGGETVYYQSYGGAVVAVDPSDGTILWELEPSGEGGYLAKGCALADDLLVVVGAPQDGELSTTLYAIS